MPDNIEEVKETSTLSDEATLAEIVEAETETPSSSSEEIKLADESDGITSDADGQKEIVPIDDAVVDTDTIEELEEPPKPVDGETPREKALRLETARVKALLRRERGEKLLGHAVSKTTGKQEEDLSEDEKRALENYDPEAVKNLENVFQILAKKHGYVKKDEWTQVEYKKERDSLFEGWLESHPEYSEEKDPDGVLWKRFGEEYKLYAVPQNPKDYVKIFNKIHNEIFGITQGSSESIQKARAAQEKIKVASHGSVYVSGNKPQISPQSNYDQELKNLAQTKLQGFSDQEIDEMFGSP